MAAHRKDPPADILEIIERVVANEGGAIAIVARAIGVTSRLVTNWFDRDDSGDLREAYNMAREAHMHNLYQELLQMSRTGKGSVAGIIYTLKAKFKQFDMPGSGKLVDVNLVQIAPVMVVKDFGSDEQWAAKCAAQQKVFTSDSSCPLQLEASISPRVDAVTSFEPLADLPAVSETQAAPGSVPVPVAPTWAAPVQEPAPVAAAPYYGPPKFQWQAETAPEQSSAPEATPIGPVAPSWSPVRAPGLPAAAPVWRGRA